MGTAVRQGTPVNVPPGGKAFYSARLADNSRQVSDKDYHGGTVEARFGGVRLERATPRSRTPRQPWKWTRCSVAWSFWRHLCGGLRPKWTALSVAWKPTAPASRTGGPPGLIVRDKATLAGVSVK